MIVIVGGGVKRLDGRRVRNQLNVSGKNPVQEDEELGVMDEQPTEAMADELRDFLDADVTNVRADPDFKEKLRAKLWDVVCSKAQKGKTERNEGV